MPRAADPLYLCLDQGSHASRALAFDRRGVWHARSERAVGVRMPRPGWVEQDPEELVKSLRVAAEEAVLSLGARAADLVAAGLATQRSSLACWDRRTGEALSPVLSWQDRRAQAELASLSPYAEAIQARTGLRLSAHYGASKMRWCLEHVPAVAEARRAGRLAIGPLSSFLSFRLLAQRPRVVDPANAARTLLWNHDTYDWDPWLLKLFGIPRSVLPECVPTRHDFGMLRVGAHRIPLALVTGDQSAALFAHGMPRTDTVYANLGTGAFLQRSYDRPVDSDRLLRSVVYRDETRIWHVLEGTVNGASAALSWAEQEWGLADLARRLPEWLERPGEIPLFLNGVGGLGAPYWAADFSTRLIGGGEPWQNAVAVVESIVFLLQANLERMRAPTIPARVIVGGGLARLDGLCQRLADISALPVIRPNEPEATTRGLAFLLADFPAGWSVATTVSFAPVSNGSLMQRYQRWRRALEKALGRGVNGA